MGKLETALRRAKELKGGRSPGGRRGSPVPGLDGDGSGPQSRWGELPQVELDTHAMAQHRLTAGTEHDFPATMAYNMLRTRLIRRMRDNDWSSVIVTSPNSGAGKTVTALNLAFSVAREQNQRTYLIDLDFRLPSLHRYLGVSTARDLTDYLDGKCPISEVITTVGVDRLYLAFNTVQHEHSAELLTSPRMHQFVRELREHDSKALIIYDAPPLLIADDVLAFGPLADSILLVVAEGETTRDDLAKSIDQLGDANLLGVVLNKSRAVAGDAYY